MTLTNCALCHEPGEFFNSTVVEKYKIGAQTFLVRGLVQQCPHCKEAFMDHDLLEIMELKISEAILLEDELLPAYFKFIRKSLGLTKKRLAEKSKETLRNIEGYESLSMPYYYTIVVKLLKLVRQNLSSLDYKEGYETVEVL